MGRAKTEKRQPVSKEKQPAEPTLPSLPRPAPGDMGMRKGRGRGGGGLFGGGGAQSFGGSGNTWGGAQCFGGSGNSWGGGMGGMGGGPAAPAAAACLSMGGKGGGLFGTPSASRGGAAPAAMFAAAPAAPPPPPMMSQMMGGPPPAPSGFSFGGAQQQQQQEPEVPEPKTPHDLLKISAQMRWGPAESAQEAFTRGLAAVKNLVSFGVQGSAAPAPAVATEDPLVSSILGTPTATSNNDTGAVHYGFTCDATNQCPIIGGRFKSTSSPNHDISVSARRAGSLAGAHGYRLIRDRSEAMRFALNAILSWWWVLWPQRGDLFGVATPDLKSLSETALLQAISKLPNAA